MRSTGRTPPCYSVDPIVREHAATVQFALKCRKRALLVLTSLQKREDAVMTELTRRQLLATAAVTTLAPIGLSPAHGAAPLIGKQAPSYYRYKLGSYEVTVISDGARSWPLDIVRNATKEDVSTALAAAYLDKETVTFPYVPIVVNTGPKLVVIDPGLGPNLYQQSKGAVGQFHTNLAAAGIDHNAVDVVIISHFHADHINGLLTADSKPAFPNAEILVPAPEWPFWWDDGNMAKAPPGSLLETNFKNNRRVFGALGNRVTLYEPGKEIVSGITSVATPGHTPGHVSHVIASGFDKVFVQADVTLLPALFVRNPGWWPTFDFDPEMAVQTRRKVYDMLVAEKMLVQGFHYPFPSLAHIDKSGTGYREIPLAWNPTI